MTAGKKIMFLIGEFSRIAQVSAKQLRHYDQLGLLTPDEIDPQNGYRYYSASQLPQINRIIALKEMGLSLAQIKRMIDEQISPDELRGMLMMKKAQIEQMLHEELARVRYIESRIEQINIEGNMENYDIVLKSVPAKKFLAVRATLPVQRDARQLVQEMRQMLPAKVGKKVMGHLTAVMYSDLFAEENVDVQLGIQLEGEVDERLVIPLSSGGSMIVSELPAEDYMLTVTRLGHPKFGHGSYSALGMWVEANGYQFSGNVREVFIKPMPPERIDETVAEIQYPVKPIQNQLTQLN
jgi:DNA-binding transcriptional MerR regulator